MSAELDVRLMRRADLDMALGWARAEGWNPGLGDADAFYAADPSGFFMGWLDGEAVGCVSVVKYGAGLAFLGLYIVRPEFRGLGYGKAIWDAGIASAVGRTIGLDGVVAQQANYRASGFVFSHRHIRYGGAPTAVPAADPHVVTVEGSDLDALIAYDAAIFLAPRSVFLREWLTPSPQRQSLLSRDGGTLRGYGAIRACAEGHKIGPLFADSEAIAAAILYGLIAAAKPTTLFIDVPEPNAVGVRLAQSLGLKPVFETARMYRGSAPALPLPRVFGVTTLELG
jgi:hypothetical protein